jgi:hypothetical protein
LPDPAGTLWGEVERNSQQQARAMVERARNILMTLKQRVGLTALQQPWLDAIDR